MFSKPSRPSQYRIRPFGSTTTLTAAGLQTFVAWPWTFSLWHFGPGSAKGLPKTPTRSGSGPFSAWVEIPGSRTSTHRAAAPAASRLRVEVPLGRIGAGGVPSRQARQTAPNGLLGHAPRPALRRGVGQALPVPPLHAVAHVVRVDPLGLEHDA